MMDYMKIESFVIPHHQLPLPDEAWGHGFRPEKVFRLFRTGFMSYKGFGHVPRRVKPDIEVILSASPRFIERAYIFLLDDVRDKVKKIVKSGASISFSDDIVKDRCYLILRFNDMKFVNL